ncbi:MAG TPA: hypothetical protein VI455_01220 [Terriglobia bacterium]
MNQHDRGRGALRQHPSRSPGRVLAAAFTWALLFLTGPLVAASDQAREPRFKYVGGTESVPGGCVGVLQLALDSMAFKCEPSTVTVPYGAIEIMQYRADVTRHVRRLKVRWWVDPPVGGGNKNRYFTLVYRASGATHAMVLEVPADQMRPYLAEIDLKVGRRVEVQRHEDYE